MARQAEQLGRRSSKHLFDALVYYLLAHLPAAWHEPGHHVVGLLPALDNAGKGAEVLDATVGAGTQEAVVHGCAFQSLAWLKLHVGQLLREALALLLGYAFQ